MAAKDKMTTFNKGRWFKKVNGKQQTVTATKLQELYPELCTSVTKAGTQRAANAWLQAKLLELAKHPEAPLIAEYIEQRKIVAEGLRLEQQDELRQQVLDHIKELEKAERNLTPLSQLPFQVNLLRTTGGRKKAEQYLGRSPAEWLEIIETTKTALRWGQSSSNNKQSLAAWVDPYISSTDAGTKQKKAYRRALDKFISWKADDNPDIDGPTMTTYYTQLKKELEKKPRNFNAYWQPVKSFYLWLDLNEITNAPKAILLKNSPLRLLKLPKGKIKVWSHEQLKRLFSTATERVKLYSLLSLNCGDYDGDIGQLLHSQIDWEKGTVNRERSKTDYTHGLDFPLWPETLQLLKQQCTTEEQRAELKKNGEADLVLVSSTGTPLWREEKEGESKGINLIADLHTDWNQKHRTDEPPFKNLRATSATMLGEHESYGRFAQAFLRHKPSEVADTNYVKPSQTQFTKAVNWLREALKIAELVKTPKEPPKPKAKRKKAKQKA